MGLVFLQAIHLIRILCLYLNMKKIIFVITFILLCTHLHAQQLTISGFVTDSLSGEKLIGASIFEAHSKKATIANNYGFYSMTIPANDTARISISYIGYSTCEKIIFLRKDERINFSLQPGLSLSEVEIKGNEIPIEKRNEMGIVTIPIQKIKSLPALGGESDIMKALQLMPGVKSGNEGSSGLYVRGGSPDQNLILLDDVPLYYVNHLGGFVSTFNSDAINQVKLIKGGFPAYYGSRLSSIVDVRMKEGNLKEFHGNGMIGLIASKISIEGPIKKDTTSYIISFRRMLLDIFSRPISKMLLDNVGLGYYFYDFNAKINHKFSSKDQIYFSSYMGDDKIFANLNDKKDKTKFENDIKWGNMLAALRWNHIWSKNLFSNLTSTYTQYRYAINIISSETNDDNKIVESKNNFFSGINDLSGKIDFEYYISPAHALKFGISTIYHTFKPGVISYYQTDTGLGEIDSSFNNSPINAWENASYVEDEFKIGRLQSKIGIRMSQYLVKNKPYLSVEPRILLNLLLTQNMSVKASYASMQQNIHLLTSYNVGIPTDLWVPATNMVAPSKSSIISMGFSGSIKENMFEISLEGYYKDLMQLITYKEGASFLGNTASWETLIEKEGKGKSIGAELLIQKKEGRTSGWVGYTLSKTTRQFEKLNYGKPYNYTYDRRHDISLVFIHKFNDIIDFSASWVYSTGNAITLATEKYNVPVESSGDSYYMNQIHIYNGVNNFRMRSTHKLDIGINFHKKKKWGERIWNFSIYNLYNRKNPYYYYFSSIHKGYWVNNNYYESVEPALMQKSLFPFIPSVSYSFKF